MFERQSIAEIFMFLLPGVWVTLKLATVTALVSAGAGVILGCAATWGGVTLRGPLFVLLSIARGVPLLVLAFAAYFGLPALGINLSPIVCAAVALIFFFSMSTMEIVRGGIAGVSRDQLLAARALGFSFTQAVTIVVLPQAGRVMLPSLVNQLVFAVKATAVVSFVGVEEVMLLARESTERTQMGFATMGLVWLIYTAICLPLTYGGRRLERALNRKGFAPTEVD